MNTMSNTLLPGAAFSVTIANTRFVSNCRTASRNVTAVRSASPPESERPEFPGGGAVETAREAICSTCTVARPEAFRPQCTQATESAATTTTAPTAAAIWIRIRDGWPAATRLARTGPDEAGTGRASESRGGPTAGPGRDAGGPGGRNAAANAAGGAGIMMSRWQAGQRFAVPAMLVSQRICCPQWSHENLKSLIVVVTHRNRPGSDRL
jgi:hypothetical protein